MHWNPEMEIQFYSKNPLELLLRKNLFNNCVEMVSTSEKYFHLIQMFGKIISEYKNINFWRSPHNIHL